MFRVTRSKLNPGANKADPTSLVEVKIVGAPKIWKKMGFKDEAAVGSKNALYSHLQKAQQSASAQNSCTKSELTEGFAQLSFDHAELGQLRAPLNAQIHRVQKPRK